MKFLALIFLFIATSANAKIIFLTSLGNDLLSAKVDLHIRETIKLKTDEILEVKPNATQWDLYQAMNDPSADGVFWLSHGLSAPSSSAPEAGSSILPKLLDYRGDNVAPIFSLASPSLPFLAIIGCNSEKILEYYKVNESLRGRSYISSKREVLAAYQINKAIKAFREQPPFTVEMSEQPIQGHIRIRRQLPAWAGANFRRSLRIYVGNHLVGLLKAPLNDEVIEGIFPVPTELGLKVRIESGENPGSPTSGEFGVILVDSPDISGRWRLFVDRKGNALGITQRVFLYN